MRYEHTSLYQFPDTHNFCKCLSWGQAVTVILAQATPSTSMEGYLSELTCPHLLCQCQGWIWPSGELTPMTGPISVLVFESALCSCGAVIDRFWLTLDRRAVTQSTVWPFGVVFQLPCGKLRSCIFQWHEPVLVQTLLMRFGKPCLGVIRSRVATTSMPRILALASSAKHSRV